MAQSTGGIFPKLYKWCKRIIREAVGTVLSDPSIKCSSIMTLGLCFTFVGYEYARAASITMLASKESDLGSEALPLTVAIGSPASALILYWYTRSIKKHGAQVTLRRSFLICISIFLFMVLSCGGFHGLSGKMAVVCFYAFREIYVSLLSSQQWAFISTNLDKSTSNYLVSFTGVVSIASAIGGVTVERLVNWGGVKGLLITSFLSVLGGWICTEVATSLINDANSKRAPRKDQTSTAKAAKVQAKAAESNGTKKSGFWWDSWNLICSHKILQILFLEAITHQTCTNMLNVMFHNGLRYSTLANDTKAKIVGRFFATVNISTCALQIFVMPTLLSQSSLPSMLRMVPFIVFSGVAIGLIWPSLISVMLGFGAMKVLEYSIMHSAAEMIYVPLGHEVRYLGKELIKFFGHKLGKSAASVALSGLISAYEPSLRMQSLWGAIFTIVWGVVIYALCAQLEKDRDCEPVGGKLLNILRMTASRSMPLFEVPEDDGEAAPAADEHTLVSVSSKSFLCEEEDMADLPDRYSNHSGDHAILLEDDATTNESQSPPYGWHFNVAELDRPRSGFNETHNEVLENEDFSKDSFSKSAVDIANSFLEKYPKHSWSSTDLRRQSDCFSKVPFSNAHEEIVVLQPEPMPSGLRMRRSQPNLHSH
eukprot:gene7302-8080_t